MSSIVPDYRNLVRLIVSLSLTFSDSDIAFIGQWADEIGAIILAGADDEQEENALGRPQVARRENKSLQTLADLTDKIIQFIQEIGQYVRLDEGSKRIAIKVIAKKIFGTIPSVMPKAGTLAAAVAEEGETETADANLSQVVSSAERAPAPAPSARPTTMLLEVDSPVWKTYSKGDANKAAFEKSLKQYYNSGSEKALEDIIRKQGGRGSQIVTTQNLGRTKLRNIILKKAGYSVEDFKNF
jgi:hypothetical protein